MEPFSSSFFFFFLSERNKKVARPRSDWIARPSTLESSSGGYRDVTGIANQQQNDWNQRERERDGRNGRTDGRTEQKVGKWKVPSRPKNHRISLPHVRSNNYHHPKIPSYTIHYTRSFCYFHMIKFTFDYKERWIMIVLCILVPTFSPVAAGWSVPVQSEIRDEEGKRTSRWTPTTTTTEALSHFLVFLKNVEEFKIREVSIIHWVRRREIRSGRVGPGCHSYISALNQNNSQLFYFCLKKEK
jgi:hypothetical protein